MAVAAANVFASSSVSRYQLRKHPNPEYMRATTPNAFADDAPCFAT